MVGLPFVCMMNIGMGFCVFLLIIWDFVIINIRMDSVVFDLVMDFMYLLML